MHAGDHRKNSHTMQEIVAVAKDVYRMCRCGESTRGGGGYSFVVGRVVYQVFPTSHRSVLIDRPSVSSPPVTSPRVEHRASGHRIVRWANNIRHGKEDTRQTLIKAEFVPLGGSGIT